MLYCHVTILTQRERESERRGVRFRASDLLAIARTSEARPGRASPFGQKYQVSGILNGPSGRARLFTTVWLLRPGSEQPTLITAFPGE
jgi:hypothetical protein